MALNPIYRILFNFVKRCFISCLLKFDEIKTFYRAVFDKRLKS